MVNKSFLLLGLAAEYRFRRRRRWCDKHCGRPSDVYDTDWTKLTALETISRWRLLKKQKNRSLSHPLGHLGLMYAPHLWLVGKPVVDFIFVVIELFFVISYGWDVYERKSVEVGVFQGGGLTLSADFRGKGASPTNHCWYQRSRVIALSCGIKISAVRHLVLSQCMRVTDGETDRITTLKTALAHARALKNQQLIGLPSWRSLTGRKIWRWR